MWEISRIIGGALLVGLSIEDIVFRQISNSLMIIGGILSVGYTMLLSEEQRQPLGIVIGVMIGLAFVSISYFTREAIGYGDSWLILILGIFVGVEELIGILAVAWFSAGLFALVYLAKKHFSRKAEFPFVPFITLGYIVVTINKMIV